jgi:multimeric flavodoxin WrbA
MKVVAFNGSPRKRGNTHAALEIVLKEIRREGIETEMVEMGSAGVAPCKACGTCRENKDERCINDDDDLNEWVQKCKAADGIIIGSPVYFGSCSAQTKAFIDRLGYVSRANGNMLRRKVGAAVVINRRAGALVAFSEINLLFLIDEMIVPGSTYWNMAAANKPGEMKDDEEGVRTMRDLGRNVAWLVKRLQ